MRFGPDYKEDVTLSDGTAVRLRLVRPSDKRLLVEGFARLSPESRYRRFFTEKVRLNDAEVRYFTEVDGTRHFALGALCRDPSGRQLGVGSARFISADGETAEPAIAVVDEMQGKGLGRILFRRLVAAARERGLHRFRAEVLATNEPMRRLLGEMSMDQGTESDDGVLTIDVPLDEPSLEAGLRENPLYQLLVYAAQGLVVLRRALSSALGAEEEPGAHAAPGATSATGKEQHPSGRRARAEAGEAAATAGAAGEEGAADRTDAGGAAADGTGAGGAAADGTDAGGAASGGAGEGGRS